MLLLILKRSSSYMTGIEVLTFLMQSKTAGTFCIPKGDPMECELIKESYLNILTKTILYLVNNLLLSEWAKLQNFGYCVITMLLLYLLLFIYSIKKFLKFHILHELQKKTFFFSNDPNIVDLLFLYHLLYVYSVYECIFMLLNTIRYEKEIKYI